MLELANPCLQFTVAGVGPEEGDHVPMLDTQLRVDHEVVGGERVRYKFYQKECASKLVLMNGSAMPTKVKMQTLSNEVVLHMRNSDRETSIRERADLISELMGSMARSGYPTTQRSQVARAGL